MTQQGTAWSLEICRGRIRSSEGDLAFVTRAWETEGAEVIMRKVIQVRTIWRRVKLKQRA